MPTAAPSSLRALAANRAVLALLAAALVLRAFVGLELWLSDPLFTSLHSDAQYYDTWARALAEGHEFRPDRPYWLPPLYPWLLSALYRASGGAIAVTVALQALGGVLATLLVVALAARIAGHRAGLAAGWLWTLYMPVAFFETRLLPVSAAVALSAGALLAAVAAQERLRAGRPAALVACGAGLLVGLATLARPNLLVAAPALAAALVFGGRRTRGAALALLLGCAVALAPAAVRNARASGQPVLVTANGGVNFWFGNNPGARGTFRAPGAEWGAIADQRDVSVARASEALGREVREVVASRWWFRQGLEWIASEPGDALALWSLKLADTLSSHEYGIIYVPAVHRAEAATLWLPFVPFGALLALAALGWRGRAPGRSVALGWLIAGLAASLAYFTYSRFRLPLIPALLPFAGRGLERLLPGAAERPGKVAWVVAAALLAQSFVPFEGSYYDQLRSNAYVDLAAASQPQDAEPYLERALELVGANARALALRARLARARGDERAAFDALQAARATGVDYAEVDYALAGLRLTARDPALRDPVHAIDLLRRWLDAHPHSDPKADDMAVLLASALYDHPSLATFPREARNLVERVLARNPQHPGANAVLRAIEGLPPR